MMLGTTNIKLPSVVETKYNLGTRMDFQASRRSGKAVGESGRPHLGDDVSSQWINSGL